MGLSGVTKQVTQAVLKRSSSSQEWKNRARPGGDGLMKCVMRGSGKSEKESGYGEHDTRRMIITIAGRTSMTDCLTSLPSHNLGFMFS